MRLFALLAMPMLTLSFNSGYYHIQSVASGKNVEARQQGLPLFITKNETPFIHEGHEQDYTVWRVDKRVHGHASKAIYTLQHNATKMYAQVYHEAFNITLMIAEKIATPVGLECVGDHEWTISLPGIEPESVWTAEGQHDLVTVDPARITRKGIPRASQRFKFLPICT